MLIYIAGYGRSGSTILERLLAQNPNICALGELSNFFSVIRDNQKLCSCGEKISDCQFWQDVYSVFRSKVTFSLRKCDNIQRGCESAFKSNILRERYKNDYKAIINGLFFSIQKSWSTKKLIYIDSSKTAYLSAYRPINLGHICDIECKVIHLVRDIRAVAWSMRRGRNRSMEKGSKNDNLFYRLRTYVGWMAANIFAERARLQIGDDNYILIRYEELVQDPLLILNNISNKFELPSVPQNIFNNNLSYNEIHQLCGNRSRFSPLEIKPDFEWQSTMSHFDKILFYYGAMPLMRRYNYSH